MKVYIIKQCSTNAFKDSAKHGVKNQEMELFDQTMDIYIVADRNEAIEDCRKLNNKDELGSTYYFTECKLY